MAEGRGFDAKRFFRRRRRFEEKRSALEREGDSCQRANELADHLHEMLVELRQLTDDTQFWDSVGIAEQNLDSYKITEAIRATENGMAPLLKLYGVPEPPPVEDTVRGVRQALEITLEAWQGDRLTGEEVAEARAILVQFVDRMEETLASSFTTRRWLITVQVCAKRTSKLLDKISGLLAIGAIAGILGQGLVPDASVLPDVPGADNPYVQLLVEHALEEIVGTFIGYVLNGALHRVAPGHPRTPGREASYTALWLRINALILTARDWEEARWKLGTERVDLHELDHAWWKECTTGIQEIIGAFSRYVDENRETTAWTPWHVHQHREFENLLDLLLRFDEEETAPSEIQEAARRMLEIVEELEIGEPMTEDPDPPRTEGV